MKRRPKISDKRLLELAEHYMQYVYKPTQSAFVEWAREKKQAKATNERLWNAYKEAKNAYEARTNADES
jgi:hypothetical protein